MTCLSAVVFAAAFGAALALDFAVAADGQVAETKVVHQDIELKDYEEFRHRHRKDQDQDSLSYRQRFELFQRNKAKVNEHNAKRGITWTAAVNVFADYTDAEFKALLGHRRLGRWWLPRSSLQQASVVRRAEGDLASEVDWRRNLVTTNFVHQQGACGSCWAVAAAGALEIHAEIALRKRAKQHQEKVPRNVSFKQLVALPQMRKARPQRSHLRASVGPVSVSVDASSWNLYGGGIFNDCKRNSIVNHAVLAVGYGKDSQSGLTYWLIRNSWGPEWGERGFVRLQRHDGDDGDWEAGYCGIDSDPKQGTGCDGGPSSIPVCGMCGVLSDSSYPKDVTVRESSH